MRQKIPPDPKAEAPPAATVEKESDSSIVKVDHPEQYPVATAAKHASSTDLSVNGSVQPDVARNVPVVSLASGRVVEIHARLGDDVKKGQLLVKVQSADISGAFSDYRKAVVVEQLARTQLERAKILFDKGAIAKKDVETAQSAEDSALVDIDNTKERLRVLGADYQHPTTVVDIFAPISGVIVEQNITASAGVKTLDNSPNLFTIADMSQVWVVCDVYENDLAACTWRVRGCAAERVSGQSVQGADQQYRADSGSQPADGEGSAGAGESGDDADRDVRARRHSMGRLRKRTPWFRRQQCCICTIATGSTRRPRAGGFKRLEVTGGKMLDGGMQEILSGIQPGTPVVVNALVLQNAAEQ